MKTVIFYDDLCGVCNYWVTWILNNDKNKFFYFAALTSDFEQSFSDHFNYKFPRETIVVWDEKLGFLTKSDALVYIFDTIKPAALLGKILKLFPKLLRDMGYSVFAYFRRYVPMKTCQIPTKEDEMRFLSNKSLQDFLNM